MFFHVFRIYIMSAFMIHGPIVHIVRYLVEFLLSFFSQLRQFLRILSFESGDFIDKMI